MNLSELWDATEPVPLWRRALERLPRDRFDRTVCFITTGFVAFTAVMLIVTVRP